jgi:hypothetical protein
MFGRIARTIALAAVVAVVVARPASAEIITFTVSLSGAVQVPPAATGGTGTLSAQYDTQTRLLVWLATYSGMTGPPTAAHFHGPADVGANAGVVIPLEGGLSSPITGQATLSPEQAADLMAGRLYLNIHSAAFPGGEIRGQLLRP